MINILGILLALLISSFGRGQGVMVGWESLAAAGGGVLAVLVFYYSVSSHLIDRWQLIKLRMSAAPVDQMPDLHKALLAERAQLLQKLPIFRLGVDGLIMGLFLTQTVVFGWADYVSQVWRVPAYLDVLPALLPYFAMLLASWLGQYRIDRQVRGTDWRPLRFVSFQARANLMTVMPIALIYAVYWALVTFVPNAYELRASFMYIEVAAQIVLVVLISMLLPLAVRLILPGGPLPEGRLRRRLESFARDRGLKVNQIIVWRTGSRMFATAFVIGLISPFRYVFITDSLLRRMNEDEVLAVFAHEMGHVHHKHLWWLLAFIISFTLVMLGLGEGMAAIGYTGSLDFAVAVPLLLYGYVAFGYISRRFERQADDFAATHTSPELLSQVFLRLGMDNPSAMRKQGWRHFSLEQRVRELILLKARPEVRRSFAAELRLGMVVAALVTVGAAMFLVQPVREDVISGMATYNLLQFRREHASSADAAKLEELRARTLQHSLQMAGMSDDYQAWALWYEGEVQTLSGHQSDAFERLAALAAAKKRESQVDDERREWDRWRLRAEAAIAAKTRATRDETKFEDELSAELKRRGLD